ncbi:UDP-3-O-acyl-N-acetylglucosamine deacetylase [Desulfogranum japonicum]|uniref:UDP-3-O-acyl-N-acetylglucosamine deacetylase n=1 Tax=Desulfogranum japonicum TaxID=231447 RepID=UPI00042A1823|nr:UDP-3-O-acyl-N-acetylglucosamine deacetylase [Desulfogranum japonicum]
MVSHIEPHQYTLKKTVSCCGVGLHTGRTVNLSIKPASANTGICFVRSDLAGKPAIPARAENVVDTTLATTLGDGATKISTTEHLMAALRAVGIDNAEIDLDSHEVPIMDGSALPFLHLLRRGGKVKQRALRRILRITKPLSYEKDGKSISIEPYDGFRISGRIHFEDALINEQTYTIDVNHERFAREIASARTFGFVEQVEYLWKNGLALGGTLANTIAIHWDRHSVLNEDGLRFDDEFIRHKVLDVIGDMALLGAPVLGHIKADRSGHGLHLGLMETIAQNPDSWEYVKFQKRGDGVFRQVVNTTRSAGSCLQPFLIPKNRTVGGRQPACAA